MLKVIRATRKSMPQFQGPIFWIGAKYPNQTWKKKNATLKKHWCGAYSGIIIFHTTAVHYGYLVPWEIIRRSGTISTSKLTSRPLLFQTNIPASRAWASELPGGTCIAEKIQFTPNISRDKWIQCRRGWNNQRTLMGWNRTFKVPWKKEKSEKTTF